MIADDAVILRKIRESGRGSGMDHVQEAAAAVAGGEHWTGAASTDVDFEEYAHKLHPGPTAGKVKSATESARRGSRLLAKPRAKKHKAVKDTLASHSLLTGLSNDAKAGKKTTDQLSKKATKPESTQAPGGEELMQEGYGFTAPAGQKAKWKPPLATYLDHDRQELLEIHYKAYHDLA